MKENNVLESRNAIMTEIPAEVIERLYDLIFKRQFMLSPVCVFAQGVIDQFTLTLLNENKKNGELFLS